MCWSKETSLLFAVVGTAFVFYQRSKRKTWASLLPILLYVVMEFLQWKQYDKIDKCDDVENKELTKLAYVLIWIQPVVWNYKFMMERVNDSNIFKYTFGLSIIIFILAMDRMYTKTISKGKPNSLELHNQGENCTSFGEKHLQWVFDLNTNLGMEPNWLWYFVLMLAPHFYLGDPTNFGKIFSFSAVFACIMCRGASLEVASYWCYLSIPMYLIFLD